MKKYVLFITIVICLFFGCSIKRERTATVVPKTLGSIITDSIATPVVTIITEANAPKVIKAAKPTLVPLVYPSGVGVPNFTNYSILDGLPNSNVGAAATDHEGNIWFATFSGLSKYDGTGFTNYNSANGMISDWATDLFIDSKNKIWVVTLYGLNIFDGKYFTTPKIDKNIPTERLSIRNIMEDNKGTIWLSTNEGLYKFENKIFTRYTTTDGLFDKSVWSVAEDKNGILLINTGKGITRYDGKSFSPYTSLPVSKEGKWPHILYCDRKGAIWFKDQLGGLGKYDGKQIKIYNQKDGYNNAFSYTNMFFEDKLGNYWIGGDQGLTKFDGSRFINYTTKDGLPSNRINFITEDKQSNIWVGGQDNGISKINNAYLTTLEALDDKSSSAITIDQFGNKWVSGGNGIGKYTSDHIAYYGNELSSRSYFTKPLIDHKGNIWFCFYDFKNTLTNVVVKFDGTNYTLFGKEQGFSIRNIQYMMEDDLNNIWIVGINGISKFDGSSFTHYFNSQEFYAILKDSKNIFWFGSGENGLVKYDGKQFTSYTTRDGLPNNFINDITEDPFGNVWLATDGGASMYDGKTFTNYRLTNGLDNLISDVVYDSVNKSLWFTTSIGLASLKTDQIADENPFFQHYNPRTGFKFSFSVPRMLSTDQKGVVWGCDFNMIYRFDYKIISHSKALPLRIKNIRLDNKNISWNTLNKGDYPPSTKDSLTAINEMASKFGEAFTDKDFQMMSNAFGKVQFDSLTGNDFIPVNLVLPFKNNNITFEFSSISPSFGKAIQYQYKLNGYDKYWSLLSNKTEANFGNMSEGNYTFKLKALSPVGTWSELSYSFIVLPPWYRTWLAYGLYALMFVSGFFLFIRWRTRALQKEKIILEEKVTTRTSELKESLENLKSTQSQLIQSEKMASLGELTAGIAHEIQNPLNFVNNFSEVNTELIDELKQELARLPDGQAAAIKQTAEELVNDIKANSEKINHHGKRAADIVKGMLQHSRSSSGVKEPTNINALADEYLRLAYHGLRAKDKSFNATMKTDFDASIGNINVIPQDIGRVILNLITNAFYVVNEKKNSGIENYEPTVTVTTKKSDDKVLISVKDNGKGIPQKVLDKIFQPFFTTKPTGQGTGLGLSLSYDIVKVHGGELKVETKEGEGSEFIIQLPI